jgi:AhpD family alkylhydroperoxidase
MNETTPEQEAHDAALGLMEGLRTQLGYIPNMYSEMAEAPALLLTYYEGYLRFRKTSGFSLAEQEVIFLTVSRFNNCEYCMAAHSRLALSSSHVPSEIVAAIRDDKPLPPGRLHAINFIVLELLHNFGNITPEMRARAQSFDVGTRDLLYLVLAISLKTMSNWTNHITHPTVDDVSADLVWTAPDAGPTQPRQM